MLSAEKKARRIDMEIKQFGNKDGKNIMLLHGDLMCWK